MPVTEFIPGQRWISNTEAELGLGMVTSNADRRVTIVYPAAEEERTYATDNAPISRVEYPVGDAISNSAGIRIKISERLEKNGCFIYIGLDDEGDEHIISEIDLDCHVQFNRPQDRLFAGQIDKLSRYQLRLDTLEHQHAQQKSETYGLSGGRVQLLPHQFYIAHEVANRYAPRVLLADEVGLGKTIEAGLILHQQLISGRAQRVLITVPDSLIYQWLIEMMRRFNLHFSIMDELRCTAIEMSGSGNPFDTAQLILCGQSFINNNTTRVEQILACDWDMLIVDEAHHLVWSEDAPSPLYTTIEKLANVIPSLLLLTATPEQLGLESHFARLRLLDPDRYSSLDQFREEQAHYTEVNALVQKLLAADGIQQLSSDTQFQTEINNFLGEATAAKLIADAQDGNAEDAIQQCISHLLDRHGTGRVLFRNTRDAVPGFPQRILVPHPLPMPEALLSNMEDYSLDQILQPEAQLGVDWLEFDPRVEWLDNWLKSHRLEKTLLICARAETAQALEEHIRLRKGVRSAVFHEKMTLINRDRAAAYFADTEEYAQVLICSEIGSEGRNFQFAQHLIMFDLPLNPDLLEQRIGRLDRIGQKNDVHIHIPYYEDSAQAVLLRWFDEGINAFRHTCPAGQALFTQFEETLTTLLLDGVDEETFSTLITESQQASQKILHEMQQGRDRLLEMSSCRPAKAAELVESVEDTENRHQLVDYMEHVFDQFGVDQQTNGPHSVILQPTDQMIEHRFPGLPEEGCTATYSREEALSREDMQFLNWEHPMVTGAMEMIIGSEFGNTAVCTVKLPPLQPGTLLVEAVFVLYCAAPRHLNLQRYQPQATVRVVLDNSGNNLSKIITPGHLNKLGERVKRHAAQNLIRHGRQQISTVLTKAEAVAESQQAELIKAAISKATLILNEEVERLEALIKVNPSIRPSEITQLRADRTSILDHLSSAKLKMDAVRIAVVSD
ncbi:RNA polymerase-associated protein RapA [Neptunomonas antarctica]|uniref:RNA polymerase-associated protein RapA n=1 Tax=Neptunomonas antarctica TaxID=619304 RepID=A0A1N7P4B2_9GAMM|nr:RNA polymerase-associated protein RapA [Neptunomonas antarctica]SIT05398.1 ATP-dependent helicase HepA [Neptunomonas antarctica]